MWVSTFRKQNAGLHLLDYDTGMLKYSIHGFGDYIAKEYTYPAGVSGFGTLFSNNSMMALATSAERLGVPIMGESTLWLIDTSALITSSR